MHRRSWTYSVILCCLAISPVLAGQGRCRRGNPNANAPAGPKATRGQTVVAATQPACGRSGCKCGPCSRSGCSGQLGCQDGRPGRMRFRGGQPGATTQPVSAAQPISAGRGPGRAMGQGRGGAYGMSEAEHARIQALLGDHQHIKRNVEVIPGGVKTTTTTDQPESVATLRAHVREMTKRLKSRQPVRMWDQVFRDIFDHADKIQISEQEVPNGIVVTETTTDADVVPMIRAHAQRVSEFAAQGRAAAAPPWAGIRR